MGVEKDEHRQRQAARQAGDTEPSATEAQERAAEAHDRKAELHEHNADLLERHGAQRSARRERGYARDAREAAEAERDELGEDPAQAGGS